MPDWSTKAADGLAMLQQDVRGPHAAIPPQMFVSGAHTGSAATQKQAAKIAACFALRGCEGA